MTAARVSPLSKIKLADLVVFEDHQLSDMAGIFPANLDTILFAEQTCGLHDPENLDARVKWVAGFREVVAPRCPKNKMGTAIISDIDLLQASARERLLAFVLWRCNQIKP
jgi:hypothetical protein